MIDAAVKVVTADKVMRQLLFADRNIPPRDLAPLLGRIGANDVRRSMREQHSPDGKPYRSTIRWDKPAQRLRDTGATMGSITFVVRGPSLVTVGTNKIQAATQHFGDDDRRAKNGKYLAKPLSRQVAARYQGNFRTAYPDAFPLLLKGSFGNPRLFLVRPLDNGQRGAAGTVHKLSAVRYERYLSKGGAWRRRKVMVTNDARAGKGREVYGKRLEFLAILLKKVRIPATPFMDISARGKGEMLRVASVSVSNVYGGTA